ncbi:MAG TPA: metalloregulator ArsR/SmtB family transcription factor [Bacillales bacterium]|nr:metalloregulator ArsR/SmtB family transcription factor [Bacillales bacterium]
MKAAYENNFENVFIALADPTRRQLLNLIASKGQATATILAGDVTVSRQAVVKHLTILNDAGLVNSDRVGREVRYTVRPDQLSAAAEWMADLASDWDRRLAWIKQRAETNRKRED